ncbi:UDP-N-acetylglucosamine-N-acetylmuramylpentapeptide N-acetylglucosamine transferase [Fontimonas thermophila]|uniref:UDP-N-acetylglucosamine--N-acetylmuramyl-(pentapeptide) pyrophosphoryl-undecaprenol N-acetylglucosamine transferase n=1 Tax=Fontimonas thermophila TaxID=1076937 RepID=A0A1I2K769_9GAMM|nr:undecaprenyldiphospho-muramoylpentapeptide beta-N-acetylglucosaminyltransferase [Fontimonas thermophila]SFF61047.1 UDP-N-acetylglucosamine-N-acetylmuramylpentapeptide N-acetylglucosamine transferase [Fontimonas thermophila]
MKLLIMAGGTGGHVYPALAVAEHLRAHGHAIVWMGTPDSFEARVVPAHGIALRYVQVFGLRGKGLRKWLQAPWLILRAVMQALSILRDERPDAVLGMGGFAAGPGGIAAWLLRRPLIIHEQNAAAGLTNRWLARVARCVLQAFPGTFAHARTVGNPVRAGFAQLPPPAQRMAHGGAARLLVVGGSQGARVLNERLPQALALLAPQERPQVRHQAGRTLALAQQVYARVGVAAQQIDAFIDDMPAALGWADLVVCRAGASTIAELCAAGCAAVLVPFPHAVDDHQTRNAEYLVRAGAAVLVPERELTPQRLAALLRELLGDRQRLQRMAEAARSAAWTDATAAIADACLACASGGRT